MCWLVAGNSRKIRKIQTGAQERQNPTLSAGKTVCVTKIRKILKKYKTQ